MKTNGRNPYSHVIGEVEQLAEDILLHEGMELVDVAYQRESHGWVLRILIDKPGGVTIDDCSHISHQVSTVLDVKDILPYSYRLEVSSPGINRPLKKEKDFDRAAGKTIRLKTARPVDNRKNFKGTLIEHTATEVIVDAGGKRVAIPRELVVKAHLDNTL